MRNEIQTKTVNVSSDISSFVNNTMDNSHKISTPMKLFGSNKISSPMKFLGSNKISPPMNIFGSNRSLLFQRKVLESIILWWYDFACHWQQTTSYKITIEKVVPSSHTFQTMNKTSCCYFLFSNLVFMCICFGQATKFLQISTSCGSLTAKTCGYRLQKLI